MKRKELEYPPRAPGLSHGEIISWKFRENITLSHKRYCIRFQITFADETSVNKECGGFKTKQEALEKKNELIALRFCDVDFRKKQLSINGQIGRPVDISGISKDSKIYQKVNPKTHAGIRTIPISDLVLDEIVVARERYLKKFGEHYDDDGKGYLCPSQTGTASNRRLYRRYFKQLKEQMGMPEDFHWHDLRHTFATIMEESRINLKELAVVMGHSSSDLTMKVYVEKKQPVFEGIKGYLDIVGEAAKESIVSRASPYRQNIIEYPGDISVLTRIVRQARSATMQKDEKFLAAYAKIPYNLS